MEWYEPEVRALEQSFAKNLPLSRPVVFYGSSSIRLWESLADDFADVQPLNLGFGGSTLAACVYFFERLVVPIRPRSIIFYAGDNDLGDGRSASDVCASFDSLLQQVDRHFGPVPFAFISIKPSPARWYLINAIRQVNAHARQRLASRQCGCYIDVFGPMLSPDGYPRRELFAEDGLHLTPPGYRLWTQIVGMHRHQIF